MQCWCIRLISNPLCGLSRYPSRRIAGFLWYILVFRYCQICIDNRIRKSSINGQWSGCPQDIEVRRSGFTAPMLSPRFEKKDHRISLPIRFVHSVAHIPFHSIPRITISWGILTHKAKSPIVPSQKSGFLSQIFFLSLSSKVREFSRLNNFQLKSTCIFVDVHRY